MLRYLTSGESHGECMVAILEGMPSGLRVNQGLIDRDCARRRFGFGRGKRMRIEPDKVRIVSGVRNRTTLGSPITLIIDNADFSIDRLSSIANPRPGHADLAGALKYDHRDIRNVLERSSARDTVSRVAVGAFAKMLLGEFGIDILSHVKGIGSVRADTRGLSFNEIRSRAERSPVRCAEKRASGEMCDEIDEAARSGDSLGGSFEIVARNVPPGLGSHVQWDRKIDGIIAQALMSIQAIKAVAFGSYTDDTFDLKGSDLHDEIRYLAQKGFHRKSNHAGGVEGGMTNGEEIIIRVVMKPIATLGRPLESVNIRTKRPVRAAVERSDICAVPSAGIVGEAVVGFALAGALLEKFGGDSIKELRRNFEGYRKQVREF